MGLLNSFLILISLAYTYQIYRFITGWLKIPVFYQRSQPPSIKVSLVIPFRNEEGLLEKSIISVLSQDYPESCLEIIYVNDHSQDKSAAIALRMLCGRKNFHLLHLGEDESGKKAAISKGAAFASGDLILFTDADCFPIKNWVSTMAEFYRQKEPVLISGPVLVNTGNDILSKMTALEHLSLLGSGAGSFGAGSPVLCSAANLGFNRIEYIRLLKNINLETASGDDIFMMLEVKKKYPGKALFVKSPQAIVFTQMPESLRMFFRQRTRWASKLKYYKDFQIVYTAFVVFIINLALAALLIYGVIDRHYLWIWASVFIIKSVTDFTLLFFTASFFQQEKLLRLFLPVQLIYPFYSVICGIGGNVLKPEWKNRK